MDSGPEPVDPVDVVNLADGDGSAGPIATDPGEALFGARLPMARQYSELLAGSAVQWGLIGPREVPKIWVRHVLNCAVLASAVPEAARLADVGSGAGLPGIVLAIVRPDISVSLVEPLLRRVTWLETAVDALALGNVRIIRSRAEDLPPDERSFDVVTARAVAALPRLLRWCVPLLRPGGLFLALKGESVAVEVAESVPELTALQVRSWSVDEFGAGVIDPPARVVRVVAGGSAGRSTKRAAARKGRR